MNEILFASMSEIKKAFRFILHVLECGAGNAWTFRYSSPLQCYSVVWFRAFVTNYKNHCCLILVRFYRAVNENQKSVVCCPFFSAGFCSTRNEQSENGDWIFPSSSSFFDRNSLTEMKSPEMNLKICVESCRMSCVLCIIHKRRRLGRLWCLFSISIFSLENAIIRLLNSGLESFRIKMKIFRENIFLYLAQKRETDNNAIPKMCCKHHRFSLNVTKALKVALSRTISQEKCEQISIIVVQILYHKFSLNWHSNKPKIAKMIVGWV